MSHPETRALLAQCRLDSPLGPMTAAATAQGLAGLWFDGQAHHPGPLAAPVQPGHPVLQAAAQALALYWAGQGARVWLLPAGQTNLLARRVPSGDNTDSAHLLCLPLDLQGTDFQRDVWLALLAIPQGQTSSYRAVAQAVGRSAAVRAAGAAIGRNPVSVLVPCHRVLGAQGALTGYAGGLPRKQALLAHEAAAWTASTARAADSAFAPLPVVNTPFLTPSPTHTAPAPPAQPA